MSSLSLIPKSKALKSLLLNVSKIIGLSRKKRGGHSHLENCGAEGAATIAMNSYELLAPHLGDIRGQVGLEIGPGDNLGVAHCFLANGAARVIGVEQFSTTRRSDELRQVIYSRFGVSCQSSPELVVARFESVFQNADFIYSIDVLEHVADIRETMRHVARLLSPGGRSVHAVDFAGHNVFRGTGIDFLTCPDWAWNMMHSHLVTSNRVRLSEVMEAASEAGLVVESVIPTKVLPDNSVEALRPILNPRFLKFATSDLKVLEAVVSLRPAVRPRSLLYQAQT